MERATQDHSLPYLGFGLRLRREYLQAVLSERPDVDWFELISESYMEQPEEELQKLDSIRTDYPLVMHGISLAIGSPWPLDREYLARIKGMVERFQPEWVSDHLCWSGADDLQGQMLPLPYSTDMLEHLVPRVREVQDYLGMQILLENVPADQAGPGPLEIPEAEFIAEVAERTDSLILVDVENLHTSSVNWDFSPNEYLEKLPESRIKQLHLLGATALCEPGQESPSAPDPVWELYLQALDRLGPITTMVDRVDTIPSLQEMVNELAKARCGSKRYLTT
ncbi:MAG: DUF692 domain-containing protein [Candidatus Sedimenticola sp. 6PFRAG7]